MMTSFVLSSKSAADAPLPRLLRGMPGPTFPFALRSSDSRRMFGATGLPSLKTPWLFPSAPRTSTSPAFADAASLARP